MAWRGGRNDLKAEQLKKWRGAFREGLDMAILLEDYRDLNDRTARSSLSACSNMSGQNYNTYFEVVDGNLKPDRSLLHTIGSKKPS